MNFKNFRFLKLYAGALFKRHRQRLLPLALIIVFVFTFLSFASRIFLNSLSTYLSQTLLKPKITEGLVGKVNVLNPLFVTTDAERDVTHLVYRGLTTVDEKGLPKPDLAESWEIKNDGLEYIFNLKKDVYWHDGKNFTADDVLYTINTAQNPLLSTAFRDSFKDIKVEKLSPYQVKFELKEPFAPFLNILNLGIIPKHVGLIRFRPIGTGPFKVEVFNEDSLVLDGKNFNLAFKFYPTLEIAEVGLKMGEIQALGGLDSTTYSDLTKNWPNLKVWQGISYRRYAAVFFNTKSSLFADKNVRMALSYGTPYDEIIQALGLGALEPKSLRAEPISTTSWAATDQKKYNLDLDKVGSFLDKSGWKLIAGKRVKDGSPLRFDLLTLNTPMFEKSASIMVDSFAKAGIDVTVVPLSAGEIKDRVMRKDFSAVLTFQEIPSDPDQYAIWHTSQVSQGNITSLSSPKVDKSLEDGRKTTDLEKRKTKYQDFQKLIQEEAPAIWLYYLPYIYAVSDRVDGVNLSNINVPRERYFNISSWKVNKKLI